MQFILSRTARWKEILIMAWPLIVANSFWNLQVTIDRIFLGQYSTEALAATMAVQGVFWTPMALLQQTAAYLMTFVAQYYGAKEPQNIGPALWQSLYVSLLGGALFLIQNFFAEDMFAAMGHSQVLQKLETEYYISLGYSAMPVALTAALSSFFSGLGKTQYVMGINAVGLIVNAALDYVMIFGNYGFPALGVAGAGYATAIASWASVVFGAYILFTTDNEIQYKVRSGWRYNHGIMKRFIRYGIPSGLQWALEGLAFTVFLIFIGRMLNGDAGLASSSIVVTVMMLAVLPAMGVAQAVSILVGQHLGEKKPFLAEAAVYSGFQIAIIYMSVIGLSFVVFPQFYLGWFQNDENQALWSQVSVMVPYLLMFVAFFTCFDSMNFIFSFALKGAGDTRYVTLVALLLPWPFMVLPTWFIRDWQGAVYWAWGFASIYVVLSAFIFLRRFRGGLWKSMSVIH